MDRVNELIKEIKENLNQKSASQKDEVRVMKAMLNDKDYEVGVYSSEGKIGTFNPSKTARQMMSSVISSAAKITQAESESMMADYEFKKSEAESMVSISKEFVNTYVKTGRKLPLGGRETSNVSISEKHVEEVKGRIYPKKIGVNDDGSNRYGKGLTDIKAHDTLRIEGPCPKWVK